MKYAMHAGTRTVALAICVVALLAGRLAAQETPGKKNLGIYPVKPTKSVSEAAARADQAGKLNKVVESLDAQLIDAFSNTRKFNIVARSDLKQLLEEQRIPLDVIINPEGPGARMGKVSGVDYIVATTIDDFVIRQDGRNIEGLGMVVSRRMARVSAVVKIWDSTSGRLLQSVAIPVVREEKGAGRVTPNDFTTTPKAEDDAILVAISNELAQRAALRVIDVIFPARVLSVIDNVVTVNRGEGGGIARDEVWEIFALGKPLVDPDTKEVLGQEEVKVGEMVITDVLPKFSKARLVGENRGVDAGNIARPKLAPSQPPQ